MISINLKKLVLFAFLLSSIIFANSAYSFSHFGFTPDETKIIARDGWNKVGQWDTLSGQKLLEVTGFQAKINDVGVSKTGAKFFATSSIRDQEQDETSQTVVTIFDTESGKKLAEHIFKGYAVLNEDKILYDNEVDGSDEVFDLEKEKKLNALQKKYFDIKRNLAGLASLVLDRDTCGFVYDVHDSKGSIFLQNKKTEQVTLIKKDPCPGGGRSTNRKDITLMDMIRDEK